VGGFVLFPSAPSEANAKPDLAVSLEPSLEIGRAFLAAVILFNSNAAGGAGSFEAGVIGGRAGYFFLEGPTAPWASLGLASLYESVITQADSGTKFSHGGAGVLLEGGVQLFRRPGLGRVAFSAQLIVPLFGLRTSNSGPATTITAFLLGLKLAL